MGAATPFSYRPARPPPTAAGTTPSQHSGTPSPESHMPRSTRGFTLIELLAVVVVAAILSAIAVPAWSNARAAARTEAIRARLGATVLEAIRHSANTGIEVVVCPVAPSGGCAGSTDWDNGWMAFADMNGDRDAGADEARIGGGDALAGGVHLRSTAGRTRLVFQPNGSSAGSNVTFTVCDARGADHAVALVLSNTGNFRAGVPSESAAQACILGGR